LLDDPCLHTGDCRMKGFSGRIVGPQLSRRIWLSRQVSRNYVARFFQGKHGKEYRVFRDFRQAGRRNLLFHRESGQGTPRANAVVP
jgi:hypothetical protein